MLTHNSVCVAHVPLSCRRGSTGRCSGCLLLAPSLPWVAEEEWRRFAFPQVLFAISLWNWQEGHYHKLVLRVTVFLISQRMLISYNILKTRLLWFFPGGTIVFIHKASPPHHRTQLNSHCTVQLMRIHLVIMNGFVLISGISKARIQVLCWRLVRDSL